MKERQEDYLPYICCVFLQMFGRLLAFFHLYLDSVLFSGPSLLEIVLQKLFSLVVNVNLLAL